MQSVKSLARTAPVQRALEGIENSVDQLVDRAIAVQQIPAPTFEEQARATFAQTFFNQIGLCDVVRDQYDNVFGRLPGRNGGAPIVVSAHSDTVFAAETDLTVRRNGTKVYGPGIADNSVGVAGLLTMAETFVTRQLQPDRDVWFVINSAEEGLGNLRGMRAVVDRFPTGEFIVVEGGMYGSVLHTAIGVLRYEIAVQTEGGHSWSEFGRTNAIHVLGHLIAALDRLDPPRHPKTTLTVGIVEGGTSINTIASNARLLLDIRSAEDEALQLIVGQVESIVRSMQRQFRDAAISMREIGNRPSGHAPRRSRLVQTANAALHVVGCRNVYHLAGSTDANIPLSRGNAAVCVGLTQSANAHRLDEYMDTTYLGRGMQQLLLLTLSAAQE